MIDFNISYHIFLSKLVYVYIIKIAPLKIVFINKISHT